MRRSHIHPGPAEAPARAQGLRRRAGRASGPDGFTLIELMVSVTILVVMILAFSIVLNQSQRVVTTAQRIMKANESALAIAQVMRGDFSSISRDGYLAIRPGSRVISFTATGLYRSLLDGYTATAARIDYGCDSGNVMWRRVTLLDPTRPASPDRINRSLSYYKGMDPNVNTEINDLVNSGVSQPTTAFPVPPNSTGDVDLLRWYLAGTCTQFDVAYVRYDITSIGWRIGATPGAWTVGTDQTWYSTNRPQWPLAIRIAFTLGEFDDAAPFEVIVPVP
jgi:prepilin-type N-terminal cleavage/methylation domain-containing protein